MKSANTGLLIENIVVVGGGSVGQRHCSVVREILPSAQIILVSSSGRTSPDADACVTRFEDLSEFDGFVPQIAIITSSTDRHMGDAIEMAKMGAHLLIEKPLCLDGTRFEELAELRDQRKLTMCVGYNLRYVPSIRALKEMVASRELGRLLHIKVDVGQYLPDWSPGVSYTESVSASSHRGGGVLLELSHELDYLQWIFGPMMVKHASLYHKSDLDIDVEDLAIFELMFFDARRGTPIPVSVTMDFCRRSCHRTCTVFGENGTAEWDGVNQVLHHYNGDTQASEMRVVHMDGVRNESYKRQFAAFLKSIRLGLTVGCSIEDGLSTVNLINTIRASSGFLPTSDLTQYVDT